METSGKRNVWILAVGMFFMSVGYTMVVPFLPVYLLELGATHSNVAMWSGLVFSVTFLIAGIMAPIWGKMSDKRGRKLMVIRAGFALAITYIMGGFIQTEWQLLGIRALQGFANGFLPAAMTLVTTSVPKDEVGYSLGIFQTGMIAGQVIGPLSGGIMADYFGMRPAFFIVGTIMIFVSLAVVKWVKEPEKSLEEQSAVEIETSIINDLKQAWKNKALVELLMLFFFMQAAILMLQPIVTLYIGQMLGSMERAGMVAGIILSTAGILASIMTPQWGKFGQRYGYYLAIAIGITSGGFLTLLQGVFSNVWVFAILQCLIGILAYGVNPSLSSAVATCTSPEFRGRAFGLVTTSQQFGCMAGPLMASIVSTYIGYYEVFIFSGTILLMIAGTVWMRHYKNFYI